MMETGMTGGRTRFSVTSKAPHTWVWLASSGTHSDFLVKVAESSAQTSFNE